MFLTASEKKSQLILRNAKFVGWWWYKHLIPASRRQMQTELCEFKANVVYKESSRTVKRCYTEKHCLRAGVGEERK